VADSGAEVRRGEFLKRAEVRDVLAWMRLLIDPQDAAAVVRALARPPVELRQVELARVIQVVRRRKLDLVAGLGAATESPQVPPEARERIQRFVELHRHAAADLERLEPVEFVAALIERVGADGRRLLPPAHAAERRASLDRLHELARQVAREHPGLATRELLRQLASSSAARRAQAPAPPAAPEQQETEQEQTKPEEGEQDLLERALHALREEVLESVTRIGGRLGELRLDTDLDVSHGVVRFLELLKLSALLQHPGGQGIAEGIADINDRLLAAMTPLQREIFQTSTLDEALLAAERGEAAAIARREERSLGPFLPRRGRGLALSASDIAVYRSCPLRYKFARVLRIPTEQTVHQRFGIVVHQVLERYHADGGGALERLHELLDAGWRRAGFGGERDRELYAKARDALTLYHRRLQEEGCEPVWFERPFDFRLGPHHLRGRVDRVDRLPGEGEAYELIDYKTSRPKSAEELGRDIQLSLYALAAREAWQLESSRQAYYYVLDDRKVPVSDALDAGAVEEIVLEVGEGILAEAFDPTPSPSVCAMCDYRIVCPAAEL
jgi:DNA helicase-2/ATP-dependent DNA helicase PcrA